jgi:acetyl-CoA decarbonylase/synthase, CODH/ACS complex subunit gamma
MALTGLQIQKLLPKTNCKDCGSNTCLAFAMKLAARKADISQCPHASNEAKQALGAAYEPPVKTIELGPEKNLKLGEETVLYRHEKTFVHQTAFAVNIDDTEPPEKIAQTLKQIGDYVLERVGEEIILDMVSVTQKSNSTDTFVRVVKQAWEALKRPLIVRSTDPEALTAAALALKGNRCILSSATPETADRLLPAAKDNQHALAVTAPDLNDLVALTEKLKKDGLNDLILEFKTHGLAEQYQTNTIARRMAIKGNYKPLGYPSIRYFESSDYLDITAEAVTEINKYGGIYVFPMFDPALLSTLMTLRLNIYTDPQKPIQVEPKLYSVGEPKSESPVFVTTNFSLTYFIVSGEIENSGASAWLLVPECEGMSVLTAWAAGKFSGTTIGKFAKDIQLDNQVATRAIIIPGFVSQISGDLEESMPGWNVMVGPQDAADIESFVKAKFN